MLVGNISENFSLHIHYLVNRHGLQEPEAELLLRSGHLHRCFTSQLLPSYGGEAYSHVLRVEVSICTPNTGPRWVRLRPSQSPLPRKMGSVSIWSKVTTTVDPLQPPGACVKLRRFLTCPHLKEFPDTSIAYAYRDDRLPQT
jgi:hypothetical protein